ncbi:MAG: DUF3322 domain-containing protein [Pseudomonadota bacterium]|nr:DUF3322 domain-containing protein [Pseudomonadota bacterium]
MADQWGLLPADVLRKLRTREWDNKSNWRARLSGERRFPLQIKLQAPTGPQAAGDMTRFQAFVHQWRLFQYQSAVHWSWMTIRGFGAQEMPDYLQITDLSVLAAILGDDVAAFHAEWERREQCLIDVSPALKTAAADACFDLMALQPTDFDELCRLLPQLSKGMGCGGYVRALALHGVGTKFIESNAPVVERLVDALHGLGGSDLYGWLGVALKPTGTIVVRGMSGSIRQQLGNLRTVWVDGRELMHLQVDATHLLIIENEQPAYVVLDMPGTVVIAGCGYQLDWLRAPWVGRMNIGYWGDLDSHGFDMLELAREYQPLIRSVMMDSETLEAHPHASAEPSGATVNRGRLTAEEVRVMEALQARPAEQRRLEQEKLPAQFVQARLATWRASDV